MTAAANFPSSVWNGSSSHRATPVGNIHAGPDAEDYEQITAEVIAVQNKLNGDLDGVNVDKVADANVIGGIPVVFRINVADSAGDTDVVMTHKIRVINAWAVKTTGAGSSGDTVTIKNGTTAITNAMDLNAADKTVVRVGTIDDAQHEIAAAGTLRLTAAKSGNAACVVYVEALRVA